MPRNPSAPRIAIWRRLKALGVARLADGVVALPEDARTREHLEWVADQVQEAGGTALLLRAQTLAAEDEARLARSMAAARSEEYQALCARAHASRGEPAEVRARQLASLRRELRKVQRRDYFPQPERELARAAIQELAPADSKPQHSEAAPR